MPYKTSVKARTYARKYYKIWNAKNRDKIRAYGRKYYYANLEKSRKRARKYAASHKKRWARFIKRHPDWARWSHLKSRYGVTKERWLEMYEEQNGCCYTCHRPEAKCSRKRLCVDHCHTTKKVRRLLCDNCNRVLGTANDSIPLLKSLISYLKEN